MYKDDSKTEREEAKKELAEEEKKMTPEQKIMREPIKLVREGKLVSGVIDCLNIGVKLGLTIAGKDVSDFDEKTLKMISPKFMSLALDEEQRQN